MLSSTIEIAGSDGEQRAVVIVPAIWGDFSRDSVEFLVVAWAVEGFKGISGLYLMDSYYQPLSPTLANTSRHHHTSYEEYAVLGLQLLTFI